MIAEFHKEQYGRSVLEIDCGTIVYTPCADGSLYIHLLYVKPAYRSKGVGKELENMLIEKYKPHTLYNYVDLTTLNPELSLQAIIGVGYKIDAVYNDRIVMKKELSDGN